MPTNTRIGELASGVQKKLNTLKCACAPMSWEDEQLAAKMLVEEEVAKGRMTSNEAAHVMETLRWSDGSR